MASLNLSTNGASISRSYQAVVNSPPPASSSPTYGQWAVFAVSTPLVSVFEQNSKGSESMLKVQSTGEGELIDLLEEFSEGKVQFAFVRVVDSNTGLPKNVLIGWCGEGVPERTKGYFTSHLAAVSKFFQGYHIQITARADGDLTPEGIVQKVADSSGSKYSVSTSAPRPSAAPKPTVASKPVFNPTRSAGTTFNPLAGSRRTATPRDSNVDDDGWGADAPPVTRTQLEKVQSAYQPTKVDIKALASQPTATRSSADRPVDESQGDIVRGGYQPIGKVDIAAIRRQAKETGQIKDERPEPVKGSYQPIGKVDIAAIRAKAQKPSEDEPSRISPAVTGGSGSGAEPKSLSERSTAFTPSERLTSLPKPKVANKFGGGAAFTGTKAPHPGGFEAKTAPTAAPVGIASRTFADQGGKTPAQLWAEKKARERGLSGSGDSIPANNTGSSAQTPIQSQASGGEWKSSYAGKTWAPVQTTHTGRSAGSNTGGQPRESEPEAETTRTSEGVGSVRDRFAAAQAPSPPPLDTSSKPNAGHGIPIPGLSVPTEPELPHEEARAVVPPPPTQPRSPTPPTPDDVPSGSPIRVAMPVGRGVADEKVADAHEEQFSPPTALPVRSLQDAVAAQEEVEDSSYDTARATAQATTASHGDQPAGGIRALVQYDYEKAEDNEIELREGEYVTDIDMVDEDWWMGVNARGEQGLFPSNYVEVVEDDGVGAEPSIHVPEPEPVAAPAPAAAATTTPKSHGPTATALYDYEAAEDNEIGFPDGAKIINIEFPDEDWWLGEYNGKQGLFPANYVQLDE